MLEYSVVTARLAASQQRLNYVRFITNGHRRPSTGHCPYTDEPSPYHLNFIFLRSNLMLSTHLRLVGLVLRSGFFLLGLPLSYIQRPYSIHKFNSKKKIPVLSMKKPVHLKTSGHNNQCEEYNLWIFVVTVIFGNTGCMVSTVSTEGHFTTNCRGRQKNTFMIC
jgi:hypothetical protein